MSDPQDPEAEFGYDGRLVFNGMYIETDSSPYDSKEELLSELPEFAEGNPGEPGFGFSDLQLEEWAERYDQIPSEFQEVASEIWDLKYSQETYELSEELVDSDGDPIDGFVRDDWSAYVYWYPSEFMILQASKSKLNKVEKKLFPKIGRSNFEFEHAEATETSAENSNLDAWKSDNGDENDDDQEYPTTLFDPEFFQWLVWKQDTTGHADGLGLIEFSDAKMSGDLSNFGATNNVGDSRDITKSHPIIAGMLDDRDFDHIEGVFEVAGTKIDAQLWKDGRVRVMAQEDVGDASQYTRVLMTNKFLYELLSTYIEWRLMDPSDKYVHPRYFASLHDRAKNLTQGANYDFDFDALVKQYANLRDEDPSNYDDEVKFDV